MKLLWFIFFVGCASALSHDELKRVSEEVVESFIAGMSDAPALHEVLGIQSNEDIKRFERDIKEDLADYLRGLFDKALEKIKDAIDHGKIIHEGALEKLKELREKMKDLQITDDLTARDLLEKARGKLREILDKLGITGSEKRAVSLQYENLLEDFNIRNLIIRLKKMILEKMNAADVKNSIGKFVEKGAQRLCEWLSSRGKEKVMGFFDRLLDTDTDDDDELDKRSISDVYEQVKEYFDDLDLDFKQKFFRFGEWVKEMLSRGLEKSKSRIDKVKAIATELLGKSKDLSKEVATQAMEYLKDYKEELGDLYEKVMEKLMKKIMEYTD